MSRTRGHVLTLACVLVLTDGTPAQVRPSSSSIIIAGQQFGPIREDTTRADLQVLFRAVSDADVNIGEGLCSRGTKILPGTPDELDVAWQDQRRTRVAFVRTTNAGGRWRTARGVRVGTTLPTLVRLAGRVLTFSGFGWDYGGRLTWTEPTGSIALALTMSRDETLDPVPGLDEIYGDRQVRSDHPAIRRAQIWVAEILMSWGAHATEHDCG